MQGEKTALKCNGPQARDYGKPRDYGITVTVQLIDSVGDGPLAFVHGSSRARRRSRPAQPQNEQKNALSP